MAEKKQGVLWEGRPSHLINLNTYVFLGGFVALCYIWQAEVSRFLFGIGFKESYSLVYKIVVNLPLLVIIWRALEVHMHHYEITEEVMRESFGILNRQVHELELYRVRDTSTISPFSLNMFGLGHVRIDTTDHSTPVAVLAAIKNPNEVRKLLRDQVEAMRRKRGVVELGNY